MQNTGEEGGGCFVRESRGLVGCCNLIQLKTMASVKASDLTFTMLYRCAYFAGVTEILQEPLVKASASTQRMVREIHSHTFLSATCSMPFHLGNWADALTQKLD